MTDRDQPGAFAAREWVERMILPLPRGGAILDLGCGGGEPIDRYLIDHGFAVTGVDCAQSQIDLATIRFPRQRWIRADMRTVAIDDVFDAVLAWDALTCLDSGDQAPVVARAAAWLKRGGRVLFNADLDAGVQGAAIARCGLIELAHVSESPGGGTGVWLARKQ